MKVYYLFYGSKMKVYLLFNGSKRMHEYSQDTTHKLI